MQLLHSRQTIITSCASLAGLFAPTLPGLSELPEDTSSKTQVATSSPVGIEEPPVVSLDMQFIQSRFKITDYPELFAKVAADTLRTLPHAIGVMEVSLSEWSVHASTKHQVTNFVAAFVYTKEGNSRVELFIPEDLSQPVWGVVRFGEKAMRWDRRYVEYFDDPIQCPEPDDCPFIEARDGALVGSCVIGDLFRSWLGPASQKANTIESLVKDSKFLDYVQFEDSTEVFAEFGLNGPIVGDSTTTFVSIPQTFVFDSNYFPVQLVKAQIEVGPTTFEQTLQQGYPCSNLRSSVVRTYRIRWMDRETVPDRAVFELDPEAGKQFLSQFVLSRE